MTDGVNITVADDRLRLHFLRYGLPEYGLFLRAKRIPESQQGGHEAAIAEMESNYIHARKGLLMPEAK